VEKAWLAGHPMCAACGSSIRLQVHHQEPFHLDPSLELDTNNLLTLCMSVNECHLLIGHGDDFKARNPNVLEDAARTLAHPDQRAIMVVKAKAGRVYDA
jgi:hypothetical protein